MLCTLVIAIGTFPYALRAVAIPWSLDQDKGKGILGNIIKAVAPAVIDATAGSVKGKVSGMGVAQKKIGLGIKKVGKTRKVGRPRKGGALNSSRKLWS